MGKDERIAEVIAAYLDRLARGDLPDHREVIASHPDLAPELERELETLGQLDAALESPGFPTLGDFEIVREVGRGGMGVVYEAWQKSLERRVALKMLPPGLLADARAVARFQREARVAAKLHHPNIVTVHGMGVESGAPYFSMEFVEGETLEAAGRTAASDSVRDGRWYENLAEAFAGAADALHHAHLQGIIHRDLKPSNLIFDGRPTGSAKHRLLRILDFGLARHEGQEHLTASGEFLGTPLYMSPEQVEGHAPLDRRTDVYSLGAALYQAVARRPPFRGKDSFDTLRQIALRDPKPPRRWDERLPRDLDTIILKCLRKSPAERYSTAEALSQDLLRFARGEPIEARPQSVWETAARHAWRWRWRMAAAACGALLFLTAALLGSAYRGEARRQKRELYEAKVTEAVLAMQLARPLGRVARVTADDHDGDPRDDPAHRAVGLLEDAIQMLPGEPEGRYHLARALRLVGRESDAAGELTRLLSRHPDFVPAAVLREAIGEGASGEGERGSPDHDPAGSAAGLWGRAWFKAHRAVAGSDWNAAAAAYSEVIEAERAGAPGYLGSSAETYLGRGLAHRKLGKHLAALEDFATARALWPDALEPVVLLAETYHLLGDREAAEDTVERFHERCRFKDTAAWGITKMYHGLHDYERSLAWAGRIADPAAREVQKADQLRHLGRQADALAAAQRAVEIEPRNLKALNILGMVLHDWGRSDEALAWFEKAIELDPTYYPAHGNMARVLMDQGDLEGAAARYADQARLATSDAVPHSHLGGVLYRLGRTGEAIAAYETAVKLDPRYSPARHNLALVLKEQGRADEAIRALEELLRLDPGHVEAHNNLGRLFYAQARKAEAIAAYRKVLEIDARHAAARNNLALALRAAGRPVEAVFELVRAFELEPEQAIFAENLAEAVTALLGASAAGEPQAAETTTAMRRAEAAIGGAGRSYPRLLEVLAAWKAMEKDLAGSVLALEEACGLPGSSRALEQKLEERRRDCAPDLLSFASVDATIARPESKILIAEGAEWSWWTGPPEPSPGLEWTGAKHDDSAWAVGPSGFGFGDGDDATAVEGLQGKAATLYLRRAFEAPGEPFERLVLSVLADDGFVAYLNGIELGRVRAGIPGTRLPATAAADAIAPEPLGAADLPIERQLLFEGRNVIAIQGLNQSPESSDFSLIPVLAVSRAPELDELKRRLEDFRAAAKASGAASRLLYFEARLLQEEGRHGEAIEKLENVLSRQEARSPEPEPWVRLAESSSAAGRPAAAEGRLRQVLEGPPAGGALNHRRELWEAWWRLAVVALAWSPGEARSRLPREAQGRGEDCRWVLERLAAGEVLRINCGGGEVRARDGAVWSKDRCFAGGTKIEGTGGAQRTVQVHGTGDRVLYQCQRRFEPGGIALPGYRVPLPPGRYHLVLHFAEVESRDAVRRFDVRLEGTTVLADHEPLARGFATADSTACDVEVRDGFLDLELVPKAGEPTIAGLEIAPARS